MPLHCQGSFHGVDMIFPFAAYAAATRTEIDRIESLNHVQYASHLLTKLEQMAYSQGHTKAMRIADKLDKRYRSRLHLLMARALYPATQQRSCE